MYPPLPLRLPVRAQGGAAAGERRQPTLVLRAMGAEERLWDLAKAYRTTVADILTANELSAEADAPGGEMLLIPCRR